MSLAHIAAVATAVGVVLVAMQLWSSRRLARTALEDELTKEYRQLALELPTEAFFDPPGGAPTSEFRDNRREFLWYIDLSNQQVFLRSQRRVSRGTWRQWRDGMEDNLVHRPAFNNAWRELNAQMSRSFGELRLLHRDWDADPAWWNPPWWARPLRSMFGQVPRVRLTNDPPAGAIAKGGATRDRESLTTEAGDATNDRCSR